MSNRGDLCAVVPLESNPEVFSDFAHSLGLTPLLGFTDIYSLDDPDLLSFLPRPIQAVILLFPVSEDYEKFKDSEKTEQLDNTKVVWMKQEVKNACGLYALLHILLNIQSGLIIQQSLTANFRRNLIQSEEDPVMLVQNIAKEMYSSFSGRGQTEAPSAEEDIELHFVCFVNTSNGIYELDGRREGPILLKENLTHEKTDLLDDDCVNQRVKKYMSLVTGDNALRFAMMGLAPSMD